VRLATSRGQITALRALASAGAITVEEACARFRGGRKDIVARHLETLAILGELHEIREGHYAAASPVG
jgi:hypothetical protein